ncbi:MAG: hypothetical protein NC191_09140 [Muribaculaceae bacterium]|nr:hypothetical protein [Muribaculaceae bacterium]
MERIVNKVVLSIVTVFLLIVPAFASGEQLSLSTLITAQNISFENCTKVFNTDNVSLFYLTIAAINANRFTVDEIQSQSGYVLFTAVNKQFIASISNVNTNQGMLRITPADGNYFFQPGIILNIYKYIELNLAKKVENISLY